MGPFCFTFPGGCGENLGQEEEHHQQVLVQVQVLLGQVPGDGSQATLFASLAAGIWPLAQHCGKIWLALSLHCLLREAAHF